MSKDRSGGINRKLWRQLERLSREDGDHCQGCRRAYENHDTCTCGYDAAGRLLIVGECCTVRLASVVANSVYLSPGSPALSERSRLEKAGRRVKLGGGTPWAEHDRAWFAAHPDRSHRLRRAFPGEWPSEECNQTIVRQIGPGERVRHPVIVPEFLLEKGEPPEGAAWAIFDLTCEAQERGEHLVSVKTILARWAQLEAIGQA